MEIQNSISIEIQIKVMHFQIISSMWNSCSFQILFHWILFAVCLFICISFGSRFYVKSNMMLSLPEQTDSPKGMGLQGK